MAGVKDFVSERVQGLAEQARELRTKPVENARKVAAKSADGIRGLREPVRAFARSGVKLSSISQSTAQSLIELQEQIVTSALTDAAAQLERAAATVSVTELVRDQRDERHHPRFRHNQHDDQRHDRANGKTPRRGKCGLDRACRHVFGDA